MPGSATTLGSSPIVHAVSPLRSRPRAALASSARSRGRTRSRSAARSVPSATTAPSLVLDPERHPQVGGQARLVEVGARDAHAAQRGRARARDLRRRSGPCAACSPASTSRGDLGHGHEPAARVLGQRADQRGDQLLAEGRHEPVEARRRAAAAAPSAARGR